MTLQMRLLVFIALTITGSSGPGRGSDCLIPNPSPSALTDRAHSITPNCSQPAVEARFRSGAVPFDSESLARSCAAGQPDDSETVLTTFRVSDGKEADFLKTERQTWAAYVGQNLVNSKFHVLLRGTDDSGKLLFTEVFTWKSHDNPDHVGRDIKALWNQLESLCESRSGHRGLEFSEVHFVNLGP
jgi:hypothetical protein